MTTHELVLMAREQLQDAENRFNNATGADVDVANAELTAAQMRLNRLLQVAKEESKA